MLNDPLANTLSKIQNSEKLGKSTCLISPVSKIIKKVLTIMQDKGYVGSFKELDQSRGGTIEVNLLGRINKCGAIKPRYSVQKEGFESFEKRYLPAKDFGIILVSTNKGIVTHMEAKEQKLGGVLLAFCY